MNRVGVAIIVSALVALTLSGCAGGRNQREDAEDPDYGATSFTISTPSGRMVECIAYDGGLSCDWGRAQ